MEKLFNPKKLDPADLEELPIDRLLKVKHVLFYLSTQTKDDGLAAILDMCHDEIAVVLWEMTEEVKETPEELQDEIV